MPNRFRPGVLPDYAPRSNPGEEIAGAIEGFEAARDREIARKAYEEEAEYVRGQRARGAITDDLALQEQLRKAGLSPATPRSVESARNTIAETRSTFSDRGGLFDGQRPGIAGQTAQDPQSPFAGRKLGIAGQASARERPEGALPAQELRQMFWNAAERGPEAARKPALLPGQFSTELGGFADRTYFRAEMPSLGNPRVTLGGQEFERTGESEEEMNARIIQEEIERARAALLAGRTPGPLADYAARDPALARDLLTRTDPNAERLERARRYAQIPGVTKEMAEALAWGAPLDLVNPQPRAPVRGTPEYEAMLRREAAIRNEFSNTGTPGGTAGERANQRLAEVALSANLDLDRLDHHLTSVVATTAARTGGLRGGVANIFASPEQQQAGTAALGFINAAVRYLSGAQMNVNEADRYYATFIPRPGDSQHTVEMKRRMRQSIIAAMGTGEWAGETNPDGTPNTANADAYLAHIQAQIAEEESWRQRFEGGPSGGGG